MELRKYTLYSAARHRPMLAGSIGIFVLLLACFTWSIDIRASRAASITGDEPFYLITTQSLLSDRDLDTRNQFLASQYESFFDHPDGLWLQSVPRKDQAILSPHNPGLSVLLMPGFAIGDLLGAQLEMVVLAALAFALTYVLVARLTGTYLSAVLATVAIGLTATPFIYSSEIYPEVPAALALVVALLIATRSGPQTTSSVLALVVVLSTLPWLGTKYIALVVIVAAYVFWRSPRATRLALGIGGTASAFAYAWVHLATFGGLTPYSLNIVYAGQTTAALVADHLSYSDRAYRLWGLLIDQRFGLGRWAPVFFVVVAALPFVWRIGRVGQLIVILIATQVLVASFVAVTMMGWWFPGRTLMAVLPLAALPLALLWVRSGPWIRLATGILAAYSLGITASLAIAGHAREIAIAVDPFDMNSPLFRAPATLFPDYRFWNAHTWIATFTWLGVSVAVGLSAIKVSSQMRLRR